MKHTDLIVSSNTSWLEAAQMLITIAQQKQKDLKRLIIKEDTLAQEGKFILSTRLTNH